MEKFLKEKYDITVRSIEERTRGEMSDGYVINGEFFLKVMKKDRFSLEIVDYLDTVLSAVFELASVINVPRVIQNKDGGFKTDFDGRTSLLFDYVEGEQRPLDAKEYEQLGRILRRMHDSKLKTELRREDFSIPFEQELIEHLDKIPDYKEKVLNVLKGLEGTRLDGDLVVCHTDCIEQNIIICNGEVVLVDWDGICLSLKEKDLWFHSEHFESLLKGYGDAKIDEKAMDYFYKMRVLTDLHEFLIKEEFEAMEDYIFYELDRMKG